MLLKGMLAARRRPISALQLVVVSLISLLLTIFTSTASANNGPHGGYDNFTSACAACHRAHTAIGAQLLVRTTTYELCITCHGSAGSGANTDVLDGVYLDRVPGAELQGAVNAILNGGGFLYVRSEVTTSAHNVLGMPSRGYEAPGTGSTGKTGPAWGGGAAIGLAWDGSVPPRSSIALECTSCHDPHGNSSYRILRSGQNTTAWPVAFVEWPSVAGETMPTGVNYTSSGGYDAADMSRWCAACHSRYTSPTDVYNAGDSWGEVKRYRHPVGYSPGCMTCHRSHGERTTMSSYAAMILDTNNNWVANSLGAGVPPANDSALLRLSNRGVCAQCHVRDGWMVGEGCDGCHESPPPTGAHLKHYSPTSTIEPAYGRTGNLSTGSDYVFGCGECHPVDHTQHANSVTNAGGGSAEIELYRSGYPLGLKGLNTPLASYTPGPTLLTDTRGFTYTQGTCSNVYCHSENRVVGSSEVSLPKTDASGNLIRDANGNLTYDPYEITTQRQYRTVNWNSAEQLHCDSCHGNPPRSYFPAVKAGVGQSHSWIDDYGYEDLHNWNMGYAPLNCRVCHYDTVREAYSTYSRDAKDVATLPDVPIFGAGKHVNGQKDVRFDPVNPVNYRSTSYSLSGALWDPVSKTCSNVGCHKAQTKPQWGLPYRYWTVECDECHRFR